ncbi:unnamed protein product [Owenia fusiformis]|uniref:CCHC-type domain-containing protein n=1 Tax=Owenia fusiformis TaxID=6347 RepID=A0A8S4Q0W8_OWEFU|nr:unnamed protein product [Owenia fusiformis]
MTYMLQITNTDLVSQLAAKTVAFKELDDENVYLRKQLIACKSDSSTSKKGTLVVGSSIVRDFDSDKLVNTDVECIRGGKIKDAHKHITNLDKPYDRIIFQIASNDAAEKDATVKGITDEYNTMLIGAKNVCNDIYVSSVTPRTDKPPVQSIIEGVNAELSELCQKDPSLTFINNDESFRLQNNTINNGFLDARGLHLSKAGSNSLARNMKLSVKASHQQDITKPYQHRRQSPRVNTDAHYPPTPQDNGEWQTVPTKSTRSSRPQKSIPSHRHRDNYHANTNDSNPTCFKCGESSHLASTCWHPSSVRCYGCNQLGHKESRCPSSSNGGK